MDSTDSKSDTMSVKSTAAFVAECVFFYKFAENRIDSMKRNLILAVLCPLLTGCWATRIVTVTPDSYHPASYTTTVTVPKTRTTTTATRVIAASEDICLSLDLQAVGAAFAQSSNVQEFENLLNDSSYMLSNLDLNGDGYVDYLRVLETVDGHNHVFLIQAVLGENVYQDVASVIAELPSVSTAYVQVVGAPYIYGPGYIIRPVFLTTPRIYSYLMRPAYVAWHSPWYWGHYPACYHHPVPLYLTHYQAYVRTYMNNHRYCREVHYDNSCHYANYNIININIQRNDYGQQHPERSFETRTAAAVNSRTATAVNSSTAPAVKSRVPVNARDIIQQNKETTTTTTTTTAKPNRNPAAARKVNTAQPATTQPTTMRSTAPKAVATQPATTQPAAQKVVTPATRQNASVQKETPVKSTAPAKSTTTVRSRVNTSGTSSTKISTTTPSSNKVTTVKRTSPAAAKVAPAKTVTTSKAAPAKAPAAVKSVPARAASSTRSR